MALTPAQLRAKQAAAKQQAAAAQQHQVAVARAKPPVKASINPPKPPAVKPVKPSVPKVTPPGTPAAPLVQPPDASFQADMAAAQQRRAQTEASVRQNRQAELIGAGFTETGIDPNTGVGTLAFNPNDPFSKAALLKKNYDASRARTAQQMGSGGGLYTGAFQQAQDIGNRNQVQAESALHDSLFSFLARNTGAFKQAGTDEQMAGIRADAERQGRLGVHWDAQGNLVSDNPLYEPSAAKPTAPKPPAKKPAAPRGGVGRAATRTHPQTLLAAPGAPKVKTTVKRRKGKPTIKTHTRSVNRP